VDVSNPPIFPWNCLQRKIPFTFPMPQSYIPMGATILNPIGLRFLCFSMKILSSKGGLTMLASFCIFFINTYKRVIGYFDRKIAETAERNHVILIITCLRNITILAASHDQQYIIVNFIYHVINTKINTSTKRRRNIV
jgi:hypothetical protein